MLFIVINTSMMKYLLKIFYKCINYVLVFRATFLIAVGITSIPNKAASL